MLGPGGRFQSNHCEERRRVRLSEASLLVRRVVSRQIAGVHPECRARRCFHGHMHYSLCGHEGAK
jgi:hypothetical protein